ncbi:MAG: ABC transporter ATP-binding protein [Acidimicrobiales bacterium]|nr:ABC transporter ATP-binding protein [Acidimicrobiales bacterium]
MIRHYFWAFRRRISVIPATAFIGGLADALALIVLARIALHLANGDEGLVSFSNFGIDRSISVTGALLCILGLTVIRMLFQTMSAWASAGVVAAVTVRARRDALRVFLDTSYAEKSRQRQGELQQLLGEPVTKVSELSRHFTKLVTTLLNLGAMLVSALVVDLKATALLSAVGALLFALLRPMVRRGRSYSATERNAVRDYGADVSEIESMALEIQVFGVADAVRERSERRLEQIRRPLFRRFFIQPITPMAFQAVVILVAVGAMFTLVRVDGVDLAGLGAVILLLFKAMGYGQSIQSTWQHLQFAIPYAEQLRHAVVAQQRAPQPVGTATLSQIDRLEASGVSMRYDQDHLALDDVDFVIHRGEAIGVTGPSGSGKSTLLTLLLRLREPTSGSLTVNGTPLGLIALDSWYQRVAYVPQHCQLIEGTVEDNIVFYRTGFDRADVERAAQAAGIHDEIVRRPAGYETLLGSRGAGLSGGQRQRVAIARALLGRPEVLVLDEPTSALDTGAEAAITETLRSLKGSVTTVTVTHRPETVSHCDRIFRLDHGRLSQAGTVSQDSPAAQESRVAKAQPAASNPNAI